MQKRSARGGNSSAKTLRPWGKAQKTAVQIQSGRDILWVSSEMYPKAIYGNLYDLVLFKIYWRNLSREIYHLASFSREYHWMCHGDILEEKKMKIGRAVKSSSWYQSKRQWWLSLRICRGDVERWAYGTYSKGAVNRYAGELDIR